MNQAPAWVSNLQPFEPPPVRDFAVSTVQKRDGHTSEPQQSGRVNKGDLPEIHRRFTGGTPEIYRNIPLATPNHPPRIPLSSPMYHPDKAQRGRPSHSGSVIPFRQPVSQRSSDSAAWSRQAGSVSRSKGSVELVEALAQRSGCLGARRRRVRPGDHGQVDGLSLQKLLVARAE